MFSGKFSLSLILIALFIVLFFYNFIFELFFFQDDFFEINISRASSVGEYLKFFSFRNDIIAYRPISLQSYFFFSSSVFGFNPIGFRLITLVLFWSCAFLIINIIKTMTRNLTIGVLTAFLWLTSAIHFMSLTWIAAAYNIIGTFFWLLSTYFFLLYLRKKDFKLYVFSFISFLITVGSFEFSVTWPAIIGFYYFFVLKNPLSRSLKLFSPFIGVTLTYLSLRFFLIKVPTIPEYQVAFNINSIKTLFWYILWSFNVPEEFKKQIVGNLLEFNWLFLAEFWKLAAITFTGAIWVIFLSTALPLVRAGNYVVRKNLRLILFSLGWFFISIVPVLLLPNHNFTMYLTLASIGIYFFISLLISFLRSRLIVILLIVIWVFTSYVTIDFYKVNSWMIVAQQTAKEFNSNLKKSFPNPSKKGVFLYPLSYIWQTQALAENHAIRSIYNDPTLTVYYNKEDLISVLGNIQGQKIYVFPSE